VTVADELRPMDRRELSAAKYTLLKRYNDRNDIMWRNENMVLEQMAETLYTSPDKRNLAWNEWTGEGPLHKQAGGTFKFSDFESFLDERLAGQIPLGGVAWGKSIKSDVVTKDVLDTTSAGGGILIPQGIVPSLFLWFVTKFQAWNQIQKVPANGVLHSWRNLISLGDATDGFIDEFGCPPASRGVYSAGNTNIAVLALRRGASLKLEMLAQQVGFRYDGMLPSEIEVRNAMISRARIAERCFYQGVTASGHTGTDEWGLTFANGFNGLRPLLSNTTIANAVNPGFYPTGFGPIVVEQAVGAGAGPTPITDALDAAVLAIFNNGGNPNSIHIPASVALKLKKEWSPQIRFTQTEATGGMVIGAQVRSFMSSIVGEVPFTVVPDISIGNYAVNNIAGDGGTTGLTAGGTVLPCFVLSTDEMAMPYIGSPDPLPIQVPVGTVSPDGTGCLVRDLIIYMMFGLAIYNPIHQATVRVLA
jgi:hypothetical protein